MRVVSFVKYSHKRVSPRQGLIENRVGVDVNPRWEYVVLLLLFSSTHVLASPHCLRYVCSVLRPRAGTHEWCSFASFFPLRARNLCCTWTGGTVSTYPATVRRTRLPAFFSFVAVSFLPLPTPKGCGQVCQDGGGVRERKQHQVRHHPGRGAGHGPGGRPL